jgi:hypothetical protein
MGGILLFGEGALFYKLFGQSVGEDYKTSRKNKNRKDISRCFMMDGKIGE